MSKVTSRILETTTPPAAKNLFEKRFLDFQKLLLSRFAAIWEPYLGVFLKEFEL